MVCLFIETGKEGKRKVREREREGEGEGEGGGGGGMRGDDRPALCHCLWSETAGDSEKQHHRLETQHLELKAHVQLERENPADRYLRLQESREEERTRLLGSR